MSDESLIIALSVCVVVAVYTTYAWERPASVGKKIKKSASGKPNFRPFYTSCYYYFWCLYFEPKNKIGRVYDLCDFQQFVHPIF